MANQIENGQLELSAEELREFTDWPDPLIEEFLSLVRGVVEITQTVNIVVEEISVAGGGVAKLTSRVNDLSGRIYNLESAASLARVNAKLRSLEGEVKALQNSESQNPVNAKLRQLAKQVKDIENAASLDNFNRASRAFAKKLDAAENAASGLLSQLMQERSQRLRLERLLPAQIMARVMINT